jgi:hypothetical protein
MKISLRFAVAAAVLTVLAPAAFAFPTTPAPSPIGGLTQRVAASMFPTTPAPSPIGGLTQRVAASAFPTTPAPSPIGG